MLDWISIALDLIGAVLLIAIASKINQKYEEKIMSKEAIDNIDFYRDWDNAISQKIANVRLTSRLKTHTTGCRTPSAI